MKHRLIYFFIALIAFSILFTLPSCDASSKVETAGSGYTVGEEALRQYKIVRSDNCESDKEAIQSAIDVRKALIDSGYEIPLRTDFYREGYPEYAIGEYEILVGETNRPETEEFLNGLQMWQYGYSLVGKKIVIAGHDTPSTRAAVDEFNKTIASRVPFSFSESDNYIYGAVKEGEGEIYSILMADNLMETNPNADIIMLGNSASSDVPDGFAVGAELEFGGKRRIMYYNTATFTYSGTDSIVMSRIPMLTEAEKGSFTYCVLRSIETKQKYVFCYTDLSAVSDSDISDRLKVFGSFAENCKTLPIILAGRFNGEADSPACQRLTGYGFADLMRLSSEVSGESDGIYVYSSYNTLAGVSCTSENGEVRAQIQKAKQD